MVDNVLMEKEMEATSGKPKVLPSPVSDVKKEVIAKVLELLGKPPNLREVTARNLWDDRWRVNVWCIEKVQLECYIADAHKIDHSYFIRYNSDSKEITLCDPVIKKLY